MVQFLGVEAGFRQLAGLDAADETSDEEAIQTHADARVMTFEDFDAVMEELKSA
jgi:hypothetical protein